MLFRSYSPIYGLVIVFSDPFLSPDAALACEEEQAGKRNSNKESTTVINNIFFFISKSVCAVMQKLND